MPIDESLMITAFINLSDNLQAHCVTFKVFCWLHREQKIRMSIFSWTEPQKYITICFHSLIIRLMRLYILYGGGPDITAPFRNVTSSGISGNRD